MGLRLNPQTGQLEDDGQGIPLATPQQAALAYQQGPPPQALPPQGLPQQMPVAPLVQQPFQPPKPPPMMRDTATESRTREVVSPEERAAMRRSQAVDQAGVGIAEQQGQSVQAKAQAEADAAQARTAARTGFEQQTNQVVDQGAANVAKAKAIYDAENQKLLQGGDPKSWWETRTTGQKVAAAISVAMGALGGALTGKGGTSGVMEMINTSIDQDYRLQLAKINQQERRTAAAKEGIGVARQDFADAREQLELKQAARWNQLGAYAEQKAAEAGTQQAAATAAAIKNVAQGKVEEHAQKWWESQRAKVTSTNTSVSGTGTAGAVAAGQTAIFDLKGNQVGNALRPDEAEKIRAGQAATNNLLGTIEDIKRFNAGHNWATRKGPDATKQADALSAAAAGYLTSMLQSGVLNQGEFERYKSMTQPGILQGGEGANSVLNTLGQEVTRSYDNRVRSQGIRLPEAGGGQAAPAAGGGHPQGAVRVTQRNRRTGETREVWQLPDGSIQP